MLRLRMKHLRPILILGGLATLGPFSIDTYFPSFPALAAHFRVSEIQVQSTLSFYLIALAGMNLFHGAISDAFGRRRVIVISLGIYTLSALSCVVAPNFNWLLALRVVQGLAAGAGMIVSRAMIRDQFSGPDAHRLMSMIMMLSGLGPVIAPIVGGGLHVWFGWRGPFAFLALLGLSLALACRFGLTETLPVQQRHPFHPVHLFRAYTQTIRNSAFLCSCLALAFGGGGFLLYVATAPDMVLNILKLSETQFAWLFVPIISGMMLGAALNGWMAGRFAPERALRLGFGFMAAGAMLNLGVNYWLEPRIPWTVLPLPVFSFGFSLIVPVITVQGLDLVPHRKGLAASLQGFTQTLVFALISAVIAPLVYRSGFKHALGLATLTALSGLAYLGSKGRSEVAPGTHATPLSS